jgi:PAS domain S-box-containing protein
MTVITNIKDIDLGDHLCLVYDSEREKLYTMILFILDGLKNDQLVLVLNENKGEITEILSELVDVKRFLKKKQLLFLSKDESFLKDGFFNVERMIEMIAEMDEKVVYTGVRFVCNLNWILDENSSRNSMCHLRSFVCNLNWILDSSAVNDFLRFEAEINNLLPLTRSAILCLIDKRKFSTDLLLRILQTHPKLVSGKVVRENSIYLPPDKFLKELKTENGNATIQKLIDLKLKKELGESEENLRLLFESTFEAVMIFKDERLVSCNPKAIEVFGIKRKLIGRKVSDLFTNKNELSFFKARMAAAKSEPQFFKLDFTRPDGKGVEVEISLTKVSDKLIAIARDVTERKEMLEKLEESEKRFRMLVDSSIDAIITVNREGKILTWNRGAEKIYGYKSNEVIGKPITVLIPKRLRKRFMKGFSFLESVISSDEEYGRTIELIGLRKNGEEFPIEVSYYAWRSGDEILFTSIVRDVSDRKRFEEKLKESERKYRKLWEDAGDILFIIDLNGNFLEANRTARELFGYSASEVKRLKVSDVVDEEYLPLVYSEIEKIAELERGLSKIELLCRTKDGRKIWIESRARPIIERGRVKAIQGIARDITERKKLEQELRESENLFKKLAEKSLVGIYLIQDGVFKYVNPKFAELWGYDIDELIGRSPLEFVHPDDREKVRINIERRIKGEIDSVNYKLRMMRKDGEVRYNEVYGSRTTYQGKPAVIGTLIDITEEEKLVRKLGEYERFYKNAQDLFFILDGSGRFLDVNPKYAEMLGYKREELLGHTARKLIDPDELEKIRENFRRVMSGKAVRFKAKAIAKDGRIYFMDVSEWPVFKDHKVVGAEGILRDITEFVRLNRLLNAINSINKLIVHEKDEVKLIKKASNQLTALGYFSCLIGVRKGERLVTTSEILRYLDLKDYGSDGKENANCTLKALNDGKVIFREGENLDCSRCEFYERHKELKRYAIPMLIDGEAKGVIVLYSETRLPDDEIELLKTLANDLAYAIKSIRVEEEKFKTLEQIEKNIENYAILVDQIRNPLAVISGIAEIKLQGYELEEVRNIILDSVKKIEDVIVRLDRGWLESEAIRNFLRRK